MTPPNPNLNKLKAAHIILALSVILVAFNIARIINVPFTHDEGITIKDYVSSSYYDIVVNTRGTANNHLLNTVLTKVFTDIFGMGIFFTRLSSLLAQIIFLIYSYRTLKIFLSEKLWIVAGFIALNFHPFLFDFWGLCRGYALSIAFMMAGIYYILKYLQDMRGRNLWLSLFAGVLAVCSNFALLNFYLGLVGVSLLVPVMKKSGRKQVVMKLIPALVSSTVLFALVAMPVKRIRDKGEFYFGGDGGLIYDTITSLLRESFFLGMEDTYALAKVSWVVVVSVWLCGAYWAVLVAKHRNEKAYLGLVLWLLLVIPAASVVMQRQLLGTKVLIERTALFFIPLFVLQLFCCLYSLAPRRNIFPTGAMILLTIAAVVHFFAHLSFASTRSWDYDMYNKLVLDRMMRNRKGNKKLKVGVYSKFAPSFQYYVTHVYPGSFEPVEYTDTYIAADTSYDYYYIHRQNRPHVSPVYITDTSFFDGAFVLLKK